MFLIKSVNQIYYIYYCNAAFSQIFFISIYRDSLGWAILLNFLVYVTLPIPLKYAGILLGLGSFIEHLNATMVLPKREDYFFHQVSECGISLWLMN